MKSPFFERETFLFMRILLKSYQQANVLSIDVAGASVCCSFFFSKYFQVAIGVLPAVVLGLSVWIIYTTDHLYDAWKMKGKPSTLRHAFHKRHFKIILKILVLAVVLNLNLILFLPYKTIIWGCVLGSGVLIYLLINNRLTFFKEAIIALCYCCGILIPLSGGISPWFAGSWLIFQFFTTALMNLLLFSWFDARSDGRQQVNSFTTTFGEHVTGVAIWLLFILNCFCLYQGAFYTPFLLIWIIGLGNLFLFLMCDRFRKHETFRMVGDGLFFVPVFYLIS